jgi:hypothetical protein
MWTGDEPGNSGISVDFRRRLHCRQKAGALGFLATLPRQPAPRSLGPSSASPRRSGSPRSACSCYCVSSDPQACPRSSTTSASPRCAACWRQRLRGSSKQTADWARLPDPPGAEASCWLPLGRPSRRGCGGRPETAIRATRIGGVGPGREGEIPRARLGRCAVSATKDQPNAELVGWPRRSSWRVPLRDSDRPAGPAADRRVHGRAVVRPSTHWRLRRRRSTHQSRVGENRESDRRLSVPL